MRETSLQFPFHEAVLSARDGSRLAHQLVGHDADAVVDEHARDFLHVIADLRVRLARVRLLAARGFQLKETDRKPVQEQQDVRPLGGVFHEGPLVRDDVGVPVAAFPRVLIIGNIDDGGFCLAVRAVADLNPVLQVVHEERVLFHQLGVLKVAELEQRFGKGLCRGFRVQAAERLFQDGIIQRGMPVALNVRPVHVLPAHVHEQFNQGILIGTFVVGYHRLFSILYKYISIYRKEQGKFASFFGMAKSSSH